ncbi:hydrolase, NUDIX family protein [Trichomonas vaginalis G3]|uniref:Hydrolase, NUDIX family protein n=1 Tax=Trichomonas vaginalis (strain ATCC PRA-98 / G3) TaxID=412133 RepID=A2EBU5_TRIV3|nr:m7G(5')pppN diphosphatase protein [Trichomonas vaginalis G3]EAY09907.1 hydrolase, NUDIX family protein [Trichomonas vaginalis G3]KAI5514636.1 m7G(5')pppN diphosphatase protein [Trichomonas vaginalis G3]|eukprot:XP_001322130.1 hydrolase, NUDIX family protein [Trichomonas vaginalis G3]
MENASLSRGKRSSGFKRGRSRGGYPNKGNSERKDKNEEHLLTLTHDQAEELIVKFIINEPINTIIDLYHLLRKAFHYHLAKNVKYHKGLPSQLIMKFGAVLLRHYPDFEDIIPQFPEFERLINLRNKTQPCAGAVIFNPSFTKVLCVSHAFMPKQFSFPKGKFEEGETDAKSVAIRECREETNIDISDFILEEDSFVYHRSKGRSDVKMFFAVNVPETIEISEIPDEIAFIDWVDVKTLKTNKKLRWFPDPQAELILKNQIPAFIKKIKTKSESCAKEASEEVETKYIEASEEKEEEVETKYIEASEEKGKEKETKYIEASEEKEEEKETKYIEALEEKEEEKETKYIEASEEKSSK